MQKHRWQLKSWYVSKCLRIWENYSTKSFYCECMKWESYFLLHSWWIFHCSIDHTVKTICDVDNHKTSIWAMSWFELNFMEKYWFYFPSNGKTNEWCFQHRTSTMMMMMVDSHVMKSFVQSLGTNSKMKTSQIEFYKIEISNIEMM